MTARETRWAAALGANGCLGAAGVALGAERFLGLNPCAFCLLERKPYYLGLVLSLLALMLPRRPATLILWAVVALLAVAAGLSFVHVGVERHWWPDPLPECTVPDFRGMTLAQRLAAMPARPAKPCEDPDYLFTWMPVSMTQMALAYAVAACAGLAMLLGGSNRRRTP